ncbi:MAG: N-6 DNA methylase, partial [Acidobacteria bacterium]|nr:N-6 DNA methylase [Acidobacteriota bacterium]
LVIAGVSGDLISSTFLDRHVQSMGALPDQAAWARQLVRWWRRASRTLGPAVAPRVVLDVGARPLLALLGYELSGVEPHAWGYGARATTAAGTRALLLTLTWTTPAAVGWRLAVDASLVDGVEWALLFNGRSLIVADVTRPWSQRHLRFDLARLCTHASGPVTLRAIAGADATGSSLATLAAASDDHGRQVCAGLGDGVLDALDVLINGLTATHARPSVRIARPVFDQCLTIVYRVLFLLFAEARGLVPTWHRVYRDAYSIDMLCRRLLRTPALPGAWALLRATARLAHAGCIVDDLRVTAFNGRLFAPAVTPLAERSRVPDEVASRTVLALGTTPTPRGRERIAFHDLGVEQLGAVYERVLDFEPVREERRFRLRATSTARKASGSFYTPRLMTDFLVRRTLAPLTDGRSAEEILSLRVLDPAMGSGAFLVAACRYLTMRAEQALIASGEWADGDIDERDRADLGRAIAERCLFGIDLNPTAVQLARLSLWLTTLAADRPLTFLDHHLVTGNSLIGARLGDLGEPPRLRAAPRAHGDQLHLFDADAVATLSRHVLPARLRLAHEPSLTPAVVRAKERGLDALNDAAGPLAAWQRAADLWCGLALTSSPATAGLYNELQRHVAGLATTLPRARLDAQTGTLMFAARAACACHWELTFPEVFLHEDGTPRADAGFDAVLGNPPWEMLRADLGDAVSRTTTRSQTEPLLAFVRRSGHYPRQGRGHVNHYQLFLERALDALAPSGRLGLILPAGVQSDAGSADLRRALLDQVNVDTWLTFDNRRGIFPIHRGVQFVLIGGTRGESTTRLAVASGLSDADVLGHLPDLPTARSTLPHITFTRPWLRRWDPVHETIPSLTSAMDAAVLDAAMACPPLADSQGWHVTFGRELNATDDRDAFVSLDARMWPVVDGRHLRPFGVALDQVTRGIDPHVATARLGSVNAALRPRLAYRDVASRTNMLTLIAAVLPPRTVSTHTVFCAKQTLEDDDLWCLLALLNSLTANFLVRLQAGTHVSAALMARMPVPRPISGSALHTGLATAARDVARAPSWDAAPAAYARVHALAARAYGLSAAHFTHVVSTFPLLSESVRSASLDAFARMTSDG